MAAGLGSIIFAIPIDEDYLNSTSRSVDVPAPAVTPPIVGHTSLPVPRTSLGGTPSIGIFDSNSARGSCAPRVVNDDDDVVAVSATKEKKKKKHKKRSPYVLPRSTSPSMPVRAISPTDLRDPEQNHIPQLGDEVQLEREAEIGGAGRLDVVGGVGGVASNLVESHSLSSSRLSLNSTNKEGQAPPTFVALDTTAVSQAALSRLYGNSSLSNR